MSIEANKVYKITNAKGGTVLDLSGGQDGSPITGYQWHSGANQRWQLEQHGDVYRFKNAATGLFINVDGEPKNFAPIVASTKWADFEIRPDSNDPSTFRVFLKGTNFVLDLSDHGNPNPGTPVTLWESWEGGSNQTWRFEEAMHIISSNPARALLIYTA
ncbi:carbohydrate-binding module family 13 protein [Trametes coccinea BRFM310]|uniref:Carbohydrate-binding module family 13 protein n=1 Tax=Trametes coccinea (strain BRFM310) TaxID=1353009 RepID=A0A1Y2IDV3_TRAC3|nr:carbohydrate-binding module family 13 protein [Trametes coccinea BRFM310]